MCTLPLIRMALAPPPAITSEFRATPTITRTTITLPPFGFRLFTSVLLVASVLQVLTLTHFWDLPIRPQSSSRDYLSESLRTTLDTLNRSSQMMRRHRFGNPCWSGLRITRTNEIAGKKRGDPESLSEIDFLKRRINNLQTIARL